MKNRKSFIKYLNGLDNQLNSKEKNNREELYGDFLYKSDRRKFESMYKKWSTL